MNLMSIDRTVAASLAAPLISQECYESAAPLSIPVDPTIDANTSWVDHGVMNTSESHTPADFSEIRTQATSIRATSIQAIAQLNALIGENGLNSNLAVQIRDVYADFQALADDLTASADAIESHHRPV